MTTPRARGSALILVIWTIAVLSVIVMSFAVEAKLQASVNVYVRERAQLETLIDAGKTLGEMIVANHQSVSSYSEEEDLEELLEDDRWLLEKRQLKQSGAVVTIGPIVVDDKMPEDFHGDETARAAELAGRGAVTVVIESVGGGEGGGPKFNINNLQEEGDSHYAQIWENILYWVGVPEDDQEYFLNSWLDWYDSDDVKRGDYGDGANDSGENDYYVNLAEENGWEDGEKYKPRNGAIKDLKELEMVGAFRLHPAVLTGGLYYNDGRKEEDDIVISNTLDKVMSTFGGKKINVNLASRDVLLNIPGIRADDPEDLEDETMLDVVNAILEWRNGIDMDGNEVDLEDEENGTLIKDFAKLSEICENYIKGDAQEYLAYQGGSGDGALYRVTITASVMGMKHVVKAKMTIKDSKPVYLEWQEDP